jgi:hypothetical protein
LKNLETKTCSKCNFEKSLDQFYKDKGGRLGVRSICKPCDVKRRVQFRKNNLEQERRSARLRYDSEKARDDRHKFNERNPGKFAEYRRKHFVNNKEKILKRTREWDKKRRNADPVYRLRRSTSNLISCYIKRHGYKKDSVAVEILGCEWSFFKEYIENQFLSGMSWDNYGEWHIDHIIPASSANSEEELKKLNHYSNLRPYWAADNLQKGAKFEAVTTR